MKDGKGKKPRNKSLYILEVTVCLIASLYSVYNNIKKVSKVVDNK